MKKQLREKIESLPPLPNSIIELEEFRKIEKANPEDLIKIIEKDPLLVANILRVANSSMFGFRSTVDTLSRAINLMGINFTVSLAIGSVVQNTVKCNLLAYGISTDDFIEICALSTNIINTWCDRIDHTLKDELIMPAFLQETGKFIIASVLDQEDKSKDFKKVLQRSKCVSKCEEEFVGFSTPRITANLFKHWSLSHNLIFPIGFVEDLKACPDNFIKKAQILHIVKVLADVREPLNDDAIEKALELAIEYKLDEKLLSKTIQNIKDEILENS